ncbi:nudix hydrolase 8-like isoform x3 [Dermatophagoides farinae]|uniref:Nucleoside diphosphate-linked moiety X motif 6 n=1 Tax=Dermatophagoides farinae TaxID=6954 RepID=A0A9D4P9M4_DERFA|nr:nucleoside diphosphate-linked moiety X motif 6-like [Dermatophagoides farinae]KAH7646769.1 nudix hydrolase 8-like isoform x3 [Dermatophagoides farinae]
MVKSLIDHRRNNIPKYAYTNIGVGGLVLNDKNQILLVKEQAKITDYWKFPGGYVEQDEELSDAVIREVYEETGINTEFRCILTIRHLHRVDWAFNCSDLYFVCHLRAISNHSLDDNQKINKCPNEIDQCEWIDINNIDGKLSKFNMFVIEKYIEWNENHNENEIGYDRIRTNFPPPINEFNVYSIKQKRKMKK